MEHTPRIHGRMKLQMEDTKDPLGDEAATFSKLHGSYIFCAAWLQENFW